MYNASSLKTGLIGLIGWRQNIDPSGTQLTSLTTTTSGMYYNDEHPLLTFENLEAIAPRFGDITSPTETFTDWLQQRTEAGIIQAVEAWIAKKFKFKTAKNLLSRTQLFTTTGSQDDTISLGSKVCGLSIVPVRARDVKVEIESIGLQFDTNQTITVYLFSSMTNAVVDSVAVNYTGSGGVQWETVNWEVDGDGAHYIVYDQAAVSGNAINGVNDYTLVGNGMIDNTFDRYFGASAFEVTGSVASLWNIENNAYTLTQNYGLNLKMHVRCDYTNLFLEQKTLFKTIIAKQVAMNLLREMAYNPNSRINRHESNYSLTQVLYEIDGDSQGRPAGLRKQFEEALNAVTIDFEGIDKVCLPCRKRSIRMKAI